MHVRGREQKSRMPGKARLLHRRCDNFVPHGFRQIIGTFCNGYCGVAADGGFSITAKEWDETRCFIMHRCKVMHFMLVLEAAAQNSQVEIGSLMYDSPL